MNCEFIDDWRNFDLTGAIVSACLTQLAGRDFSFAVMPNVDFSNGYLAKVDFSNASLQHANFSGANLTGASFQGAALSNNVGDNISETATFEGAHLKNVNLSNAQLSGVTFTSANFYGSAAANSSAGCKTTQADNAGFAIGCSTAFKAIMTGTVLVDAYLFGVDFTSAQIKGADFTNAVLTGATFVGATIESSGTGAPTKFIGAHLQGTELGSAASADMTNAFIDFRSAGNIMFLNLSGSIHNAFACGTSTCVPASGKDVCTQVQYDKATSVPQSNANITCPDKTKGPCGAAGDPKWKSTLDIAATGSGLPPQGWYLNDATYTPKTPLAEVCNKQGYVSNW